MRIIKIAAKKDLRVPAGFMAIIDTYDENGELHQEIFRDGKSLCDKEAKKLLEQDYALEGWGDGKETASGLTNEGQEQESKEMTDKYEKERVKPATPIVPAKKPGFQMPAPKPKTKQLYREV